MSLPPVRCVLGLETCPPSATWTMLPASVVDFHLPVAVVRRRSSCSQNPQRLPRRHKCNHASRLNRQLSVIFGRDAYFENNRLRNHRETLPIGRSARVKSVWRRSRNCVRSTRAVRFRSQAIPVGTGMNLGSRNKAVCAFCLVECHCHQAMIVPD